MRDPRHDPKIDSRGERTVNDEYVYAAVVRLVCELSFNRGLCSLWDLDTSTAQQYDRSSRRLISLVLHLNLFS